MGKATRNRAARASTTVRGELIKETREPEVPRDWPRGHVGVTLTDPDQDECILVEIHGVKHYLHTTTARELEKMLHSRIEEWDATAGGRRIEPVEAPISVDYSEFCMVVILARESDDEIKFIYERPQMASDEVLEAEAHYIFEDLMRRSSSPGPLSAIGVVRNKQQADEMLDDSDGRICRVL